MIIHTSQLDQMIEDPQNSEERLGMLRHANKYAIRTLTVKLSISTCSILVPTTTAGFGQLMDIWQMVLIRPIAILKKMKARLLMNILNSMQMKKLSRKD